MILFGIEYYISLPVKNSLSTGSPQFYNSHYNNKQRFKELNSDYF